MSEDRSEDRRRAYWVKAVWGETWDPDRRTGRGAYESEWIPLAMGPATMKVVVEFVQRERGNGLVAVKWKNLEEGRKGTDGKGR